MRKFNLVIALISAPILCWAQTIPNTGFENWQTGGGGTYKEPVGWNTTNQQTTSQPYGETILQSADAHSGNFACQISNQDTATPGTNYPGLITNGSFLHNGGLLIGVYGGTPCNAVPDSIIFYYKYESTADSARFFVEFHHYDTVNHLEASAANNNAILPPAATYTRMSLPIIKDPSNIVPDSFLITFQSCLDALAPKNGKLWIDDIAFYPPLTGVSEVSKEIEVDVFPNPANQFVGINTPMDLNPPKAVSIYTMDGKQMNYVYNGDMKRQLTIPASNLPRGTYVIKIEWPDGLFTTRNVVLEK